MNLVVLSRDNHLYSTRSIIDAALHRGHNVHVVNHMKCLVKIEKGKPSIYYRGEALKKVDAIIPRIGASVTQLGATVVQQFEMMNVFTTASSQSLLISRDKLRCSQLLTAAGIKVPDTIYSGSAKNSEEMIKEIGGAPLVIKLLQGTQGIGVVLAETYKTANSVIDAFHAMNAEFVVQEFIKESAATDLRAFVIGEEIVASIIRKGKKGEFRSNLHRGGEGEIVKLTDAEKRTAIAAAKAMNLLVAGVDMLRSKRGPLVIEVNSSPGLEGIETISGIDVAGKMIEYIEKIVKKRNKR